MSEEAATFALAAAIDKLADAVTQHSLALMAPKAAAPNVPLPTQPVGPPPAAAGAPPKPEKTLQEKRGGLIFFACRDNGYANKAGEIGARVLGRPMGNDSRLWTDDEQKAVLDQMKAWGWIEDKR